MTDTGVIEIIEDQRGSKHDEKDHGATKQEKHILNRT